MVDVTLISSSCEYKGLHKTEQLWGSSHCHSFQNNHITTTPKLICSLNYFNLPLTICKFTLFKNPGILDSLCHPELSGRDPVLGHILFVVCPLGVEDYSIMENYCSNCARRGLLGDWAVFCKSREAWTDFYAISPVHIFWVCSQHYCQVSHRPGHSDPCAQSYLRTHSETRIPSGDTWKEMSLSLWLIAMAVMLVVVLLMGSPVN